MSKIANATNARKDAGKKSTASKIVGARSAKGVAVTDTLLAISQELTPEQRDAVAHVINNSLSVISSNACELLSVFSRSSQVSAQLVEVVCDIVSAAKRIEQATSALTTGCRWRVLDDDTCTCGSCVARRTRTTKEVKGHGNPR